MIKPMQIRSWNDLLFLIARQTDRERNGFPSLVEATIIHGSSQEILYTGGRGRLREHGRIGKSMPAVLASRSSSLPREEATNAGLNARHESNLPRQLLDICGLHSARNLRDLSTNSSNAESLSLSLSLSSLPLLITFAQITRLRPRPLGLPVNRKLPSARNRFSKQEGRWSFTQTFLNESI